MRPHIHTLTCNLLWEKTLTFSSWEAGRTQRALTESFQGGGKGINVSKMLTRLGVPNTAVFLPGGATGTDCEQWVRAQGVVCRTFPVATPTRVGIVVRAPGRPETTFLGPDVPPDAAAVRACAEYVDGLPAGDLLAVCGSLPGWNTEVFEPLRAAFSRWQPRGLTVADTYGPALAWLIERPLEWVKVNRAEFETLFTGKYPPLSMPERLAAAMARWAPKAWIVTDGPRPVWFAERGSPPTSVVPPVVAEVSATGSGDVLHACLLDAVFHCGHPLAVALRLALPYAAANAAQGTVADFSFANLPDFRSAG